MLILEEKVAISNSLLVAKADSNQGAKIASKNPLFAMFSKEGSLKGVSLKDANLTGSSSGAKKTGAFADVLANLVNSTPSTKGAKTPELTKKTAEQSSLSLNTEASSKLLKEAQNKKNQFSLDTQNVSVKKTEVVNGQKETSLQKSANLQESTIEEKNSKVKKTKSESKLTKDGIEGNEAFLTLHLNQMNGANSLKKTNQEADVSSSKDKKVSDVDAKKKQTKGEKLNLQVNDFRQVDQGDSASIKKNEAESRVSSDSKDVRFVLGENASNPGKESLSVKSGSETFQGALERALHDNFNGEIARTGSIVLKANDTGIIRLALRPEALGTVKIELNLADNSITGKIIVESEEAKAAFENNINDMVKSFQEQGFDSAKLEVSVGSNGGFQERQNKEQESSKPWFSERSLSFDGASITSTDETLRDGQLNIVV